MTAPITSAARRTVNSFSVLHAALLDGTTAATETDLYGVRTASAAPDLGNADITGDDDILDTFNWFNYGTLSIESGYIGFDTYAKIAGTQVTVGGTATAAEVLFTPAAAGGTASGDSYDYSGPAATTFTVDGTTIALNSDLTDLAGVVAAVDAALGAAYTVTANAGQVSIALTAAGTGSIAIGGADAAAVTGSPGYTNTAGANASEISIPIWQEGEGNQRPWPILITTASNDALGNPYLLYIIFYKVKLGVLQLQGPAYKTGATFTYGGRILRSAFDEKGQPLAKKACGRLVSAVQL